MRMNNIFKTFSRGFLSDLIELWRSQLHEEINSLTERRILETDIEELIEYFVKKYYVDPLIFDSTDPIFDYQESTQIVEDYGERISVPCFECWLDVPFKGTIELLKHQPSSFRIHKVPFEVHGSFFRFRQTVRSLENENIKHRFDSDINDTILNIERCNEQVGKFNTTLRKSSQDLLKNRREGLLKTSAAVAALPYRIRKRNDESSAFNAPIKRRKIVAELPTLAESPGKPEPVLSLAMYKEILHAISRFSETVERSPSAFLEQDEEAIRFQILAALNTAFETDGTGETFNHSGKTDILLRSEGRNIFIAECKFWHGEKTYLETVDQLLGYLTWRDTKTAIIVFSKNKDFSNVLTKIRTATPTHQNFIKQLDFEDETRFDYIFSQVNDPDRRIFLSTLAFNIPKK